MMAANYRHIGGLENRLGRHYSRFSASWPAAPLPLNHLPGENRQTMGRIGEVRLVRPTVAPRLAACAVSDTHHQLNAGLIGLLHPASITDARERRSHEAKTLFA